MTRRFLTPFLLLATACSQRSPWVAVSAPSVARRPAAIAAPDSATIALMGSLAFPVAGVDSTRLDDTFQDARDGGSRTHHAIDIMAPRGSAVLAVQDGRILRLSKSDKGGTTIYATDLTEHFVYYYAHLDRYHANVYDGRPVVRGDTIGYVGTTGNAPKNLPHLHFQVMRMPPDRKYWVGEPINPYPLLRPAASSSQWR